MAKVSAYGADPLPRQRHFVMTSRYMAGYEKFPGDHAEIHIITLRVNSPPPAIEEA
jgi:hypothetical protein